MMWAHYSEKGAGIVLGFEIPDEILAKIQYVSRRLRNPLKLSHLNKILEAVGDNPLKVKYDGWKYEREQRLHLRLDKAIDGIHYKDFSHILCLREVIIGERCTLSVSDVEHAVGKPIASVRIRKARPSFNGFGITTRADIPLVTVKGSETARQFKKTLAELMKTDVNCPPNEAGATNDSR